MKKWFRVDDKQKLLGTYDVDSIMHYGPSAFSLPGRKVFQQLKGLGTPIGQRSHLSVQDVKEINELYHCGKY